MAIFMARLRSDAGFDRVVAYFRIGNWCACRPDAHVEFTTIWQDENEQAREL
jgi:hypothetical protein